MASWKERGETKRKQLSDLIPNDWKIDEPPPEKLPCVLDVPEKYLSEKEKLITQEFTAVSLLNQIAQGRFSALQVARAFSHRASIAHQLVNCLSDIMFEDAFRDARSLDKYLATHGKPIGPLHGLPISLKDQFRVRSTSATIGYVARLELIDEEESFLVSKLRELGAVIYVKTNVPTSLMAIETNNNIVGLTMNPHNRLLSAGGSSGGEAALLALRGSLIGLGSDVGKCNSPSQQP